MLENPQEDSPEFRQLVIELMQTERAEMERLAQQNDISPEVANRAMRHLQLTPADADG
jgi:transposase-like protein